MPNYFFIHFFPVLADGWRANSLCPPFSSCVFHWRGASNYLFCVSVSTNERSAMWWCGRRKKCCFTFLINLNLRQKIPSIPSPPHPFSPSPIPSPIALILRIEFGINSRGNESWNWWGQDGTWDGKLSMSSAVSDKEHSLRPPNPNFPIIPTCHCHC